MPREKEFALKGGHPKRTATFEWNALTRFLENGKMAAASELKMGERATVNYARNGKQRVATRIAISPSGTRKEFAHNWLDSLKGGRRPSSESTRFVENGKPGCSLRVEDG